MDHTSIENKKSQMRKGMIEFSILLVIAQGKVYSSDILRTLKEANLIVVEGTLYPLLNRMRTSQLVEYHWEESKSGPPRKYYVLTPKGEQLLAELQTAFTELTKSITHLSTQPADANSNSVN